MIRDEERDSQTTVYVGMNRINPYFCKIVTKLAMYLLPLRALCNKHALIPLRCMFVLLLCIALLSPDTGLVFVALLPSLAKRQEFASPQLTLNPKKVQQEKFYGKPDSVDERGNSRRKENT